MEQERHEDRRNLADATDRILAGERDEDVLCENLHYNQAVIVMAILEGLRSEK